MQQPPWFAEWCSGSAVQNISKVTLHQAQLVLEWVTIFGRVYRLSM